MLNKDNLVAKWKKKKYWWKHEKNLWFNNSYTQTNECYDII